MKYMVLGLVLAFLSCRKEAPQGNLPVVIKSVAASQPRPTVETRVFNKLVGHGDDVFVGLDPTRRLMQVTPFFKGSYTLPASNSDGSLKKDSQGNTYFRDSIYASGKVLDVSGKWQPLSWAQFSDANERKVWQDLKIPRAVRLKLDFHYGARYARDKDVLGSGRQVKLEYVVLRYQDDKSERSFVQTYNPQATVRGDVPLAVATGGKKIAKGKSHSIDFDATGRKVYKILIRWGDATRPGSTGAWHAGFATGGLVINGRLLGKYRDVAYIEDQIWDDLNLTGKLNIGVNFKNHFGRIHEIRIFHTALPANKQIAH